MKTENKESSWGVFTLLFMVCVGMASMYCVNKAVDYYDTDTPVVHESELAEVITKLDTLRTGLNVVHANQSFMWTNGIVKLRQGQNLLLRAQIKAGTLKVEKKETTEKEAGE